MVVPQNYIYAKAAKRNKKRIFIFVFYILLALGSLAAAVYLIFFTQYFQIQKISFYGMNVIQEDILKQISAQYLETEKYYFFEQKNLLAMSSNGLTEMFKRELRRVKNVSVDKKFPNILDISIEEYTPAGIACNNTDAQSQRCFYFDNDGVVFDEAPFIVGELLLFIYDENINIISFPESKYSAEFIKFMLEFKQKISEENILAIEYFKVSNKFGDIEVMFRVGFKIFLSQSQMPEEQAKAALEILNSQAGNIQNLDYIDLRIKNRAYYKLKALESQAPQQ